ncbi:hypothetical protein BXZ70DRAFT_131029 [Cristinia sonorae]|uniref:Uncharacterized protein n=1 Tax=Cristinia sonorae TaxID=1940300 RepID=A0A8K0XQ93_9AGAR|nr:hypothetical protein BXZ70DRAFT_131029 [Cristinia sonorae]
MNSSSICSDIWAQKKGVGTLAKESRQTASFTVNLSNMFNMTSGDMLEVYVFANISHQTFSAYQWSYVFNDRSSDPTWGVENISTGENISCFHTGSFDKLPSHDSIILNVKLNTLAPPVDMLNYAIVNVSSLPPSFSSAISPRPTSSLPELHSNSASSAPIERAARRRTLIIAATVGAVLVILFLLAIVFSYFRRSSPKRRSSCFGSVSRGNLEASDAYTRSQPTAAWKRRSSPRTSQSMFGSRFSAVSDPSVIDLTRDAVTPFSSQRVLFGNPDTPRSSALSDADTVRHAKLLSALQTAFHSSPTAQAGLIPSKLGQEIETEILHDTSVSHAVFTAY